VRDAEVVGAKAFRIAIRAMVEPALARDVVVDADDVGRAGIVLEPQEFAGVGAVVGTVVGGVTGGPSSSCQRKLKRPCPFGLSTDQLIRTCPV